MLQVPFQAVVSAAKVRYIFVLGPRGPERREVTTGAANDTHMEILDGVKAGEQVILNPRTHFADELVALGAAADNEKAADDKTKAAADGADGGKDAGANKSPGGSTAGAGGPGAGGPNSGGPGAAGPGGSKSAGASGGNFNPAAVFARMDANSDGALTSDEVTGRLAENFASSDANSDGKIDSAEFAAAMTKLRASGGPRSGGGGSGSGGGPEWLRATEYRRAFAKPVADVETGGRAKSEFREARRRPLQAYGEIQHAAGGSDHRSSQALLPRRGFSACPAWSFG